jgi:Protein of unknown function (DUF3800)
VNRPNLPVKKFDLYIDESGSQKPSPEDKTPFFAMGGILLERENEVIIKNSVVAFKECWYPRLKILDLCVPLHYTDIRSKKKNFRELENFSIEDLNNFYQSLNQMAINTPIVIHACVVSRSGYLKRFEPVHGEKTWEMMRSSFYILIERTAKYVKHQNGVMKVYFEEIGNKENKKIKEYYEEIKMKGIPFSASTSSQYNPLSAKDFSNILAGIEYKQKSHLILQLADFCLHPIADMKKHPTNRAYQAFKDGNIIVDSLVSQDLISEMGIKYYCY